MPKLDHQHGDCCSHPDNEEREGSRCGRCSTYGCPIALELDEEDEECQNPESDDYVEPEAGQMRLYLRPRHAFASNVWLGVTVENQQTANERIPVLRNTPAVKRFVSIEPMLEPIDLTRIVRQTGAYKDDIDNALEGLDYEGMRKKYHNQAGSFINLKLDWVIVGGETGRNARPMNPDWARAIRDQCRRTSTPFFFKQMSNKQPIPDDLRVREFPTMGINKRPFLYQTNPMEKQ